jgi:hypothetical protein
VQTFLDQAPTLVGVLLGALATIVATSVNDRSRWRRTQSVRWDERRLAAYTEFARAVKGVYAAASRLAAARIPRLTMTPVDRETGLAMLTEANNERTRAWEAVLLLGDEATVRAAAEWRRAVWQVERIAVDPALGTPDWIAAVRDVDQARDRFYTAARGSLSVSGGSVAQAPWLATAPWSSYGSPAPAGSAIQVGDDREVVRRPDPVDGGGAGEPG